MEDIDMSSSIGATTMVSIEEELRKKYEAALLECERLGARCSELEEKKYGRPAIPNKYRDENIDGKVYVIGTLVSKGLDIQFIIDKDDEEEVKTRQWYAHTNGKYVACGINTKDGRKVMYLHNFIMNRITFPGKGSKESVDHINRNGLDNRKENLRIVTQREQNLNQNRRKRTCELPSDSGLTHDDIPKHVWYIKANGAHGDRFGIDLKTEGIKWKSSSSKTIPLREKLEQAKTKLKELYETYPYLEEFK